MRYKPGVRPSGISRRLSLGLIASIAPCVKTFAVCVTPMVNGVAETPCLGVSPVVTVYEGQDRQTQGKARGFARKMSRRAPGCHGSLTKAPPDERGGQPICSTYSHRATLLLYALLSFQSGAKRMILTTGERCV